MANQSSSCPAVAFTSAALSCATQLLFVSYTCTCIQWWNYPSCTQCNADVKRCSVLCPSPEARELSSLDVSAESCGHRAWPKTEAYLWMLFDFCTESQVYVLFRGAPTRSKQLSSFLNRITASCIVDPCSVVLSLSLKETTVGFIVCLVNVGKHFYTCTIRNFKVLFNKRWVARQLKVKEVPAVRLWLCLKFSKMPFD